MILVYDGDLKIYGEVTNSSFLNNNKPGGQDVNYYLKSKNKEYPQFVFTDLKVAAAGKFNYVKKAVAKYLEDDCPKIEELLVRKDINDNGFARIGEIYDETCGK